VPDLEHFAAASTPNTLQFVVPHTLHEHRLRVLFGPRLAHWLLLLLLLSTL
jgi:hypothetical protein